FGGAGSPIVCVVTALSVPLGSMISWHFEQKNGPAAIGGSFSAWQGGQRVGGHGPPRRSPPPEPAPGRDAAPPPPRAARPWRGAPPIACGVPACAPLPCGSPPPSGPRHPVASRAPRRTLAPLFPAGA